MALGGRRALRELLQCFCRRPAERRLGSFVRLSISGAAPCLRRRGGDRRTRSGGVRGPTSLLLLTGAGWRAERVGFVNSVGPVLRANRASQSGRPNTPMASAGRRWHRASALRPGRGIRVDGDQTTGA